MNQNRYAFISYSSQDRPSADLLRGLLLERGVSCWMAPYDVPPGSKYAHVINDALERCACLVLLLTQAAQQSQFVEREVERAMTYGKPIIPVELEPVELNSGFKFYLGNRQIIPLPQLRREAPAFQHLVDGICRHLPAPPPPPPAPRTPQLQSCEITVFSPVNTQVFLEDRDHLLMTIDRNSGFDYRFATALVPPEFTLLFAARGFEKRASFQTPEDRALQFNLNAVLSREEILACYSREEALARLAADPTAYAFEQLAAVGREEDLPALLDCLDRLRGETAPGGSASYRLARAAEALGQLALRYRAFRCLPVLSAVYETFPAKSSYGYLIRPVLERLRAAAGAGASL